MTTEFELNGVSSDVRLGKGGVRIRDNAGAVENRNPDNTAFVNARGADAVDPNDFVTFQQFQAAISGLDWKENVVSVTSTAIDLTGGTFTNDGSATNGVTLADGDRLLVTEQNVAGPDVTNGIYDYVAGSNTFTRSSDLAAGSDAEGAVVSVTQGTLAGTVYRQTQSPAIVGTDALAWEDLPIGTGISSIVSSGGTVSLVNAGAPPTAQIKGLDNTATITFTDNGTSVEANINPGSVGTTELTDGAVTEAKLAPGVVLTRRVAITNADVPGTTNIGAVLPAGNYRVIGIQIPVNTGFASVAAPAEVAISDGTQTLMTTAQSDLAIEDTYISREVAAVSSAGATQLQAIFTGAATAGAGEIIIQLIAV